MSNNTSKNFIRVVDEESVDKARIVIDDGTIGTRNKTISRIFFYLILFALNKIEFTPYYQIFLFSVIVVLHWNKIRKELNVGNLTKIYKMYTFSNSIWKSWEDTTATLEVLLL